MTGYVYMKDVRFHAFHGVDPQEQTVGADFILNIRVRTDLSKAMETDDVRDTVSYAVMYEIARKEMATPSKLLEHAAGRIVKGILSAYPQIESIDLSLTKSVPPMGADCDGAGVELHIINQKTI